MPCRFLIEDPFHVVVAVLFHLGFHYGKDKLLFIQAAVVGEPQLFRTHSQFLCIVLLI